MFLNILIKKNVYDNIIKVYILYLGGDTLRKKKEEQIVMDNSEIVGKKQTEEVKQAESKQELEVKENEQKDETLPTIDSNELEDAKTEPKKKKREGSAKEERKKRFGGLSITLLVTAIILVVLAIAVVVFAVMNKVNTGVYSNVWLNGVEISGKTEEEIDKYLSDLNNEFKVKNLVIKDGEKEIISITPDSIDMAIDELKTKSKIMAFGRDGNLINNNINILKALFKKHEIEIEYYYSDSKLNDVATQVAEGIDEKVIDDTFSVDSKNNVLVITKGKSGRKVMVTEFQEQLVSALKLKNVTEFKINAEEAKPQELDVDVVFAKVSKEAKDAYVDDTTKPPTYHNHELGVTFDKEELRKVLEKEENKAEEKVIKFNLTTTKPNVTLQDITKNLYLDKLGTHTSSFSDSGANRANNVKLGAKILNGAVVMPGETFSFNKTMGDCGQTSRGFKAASTFKGGTIVQEIGGGICQVSSTLYVAALKANLEIVSRKAHGLPVAYVPASLDATIYYPYLDFKFKNTRNYPIKVVAETTSSRKLVISICGTKEEVEYEVELTSKKTGTIAPKVQKRNDSSLAVGKTKTIQSGFYGYTSEAYKILKLNGKVISKTLLSEDKYGSTPTIIAVGTKKVTTPAEVTPPAEGDTPTVDNVSGEEGVN